MRSIEAIVAAEIDRPGPPEVSALADDILRGHEGILAILFYGSCRRSLDMGGLIDLYVLYDRHSAFHDGRVAALLNQLLPPNVLSATRHASGQDISAKVAVMSLRQFQRRMRKNALDTTIWTRFCQPASLIYARDEAARRDIVAALAAGIRTAIFWARRLGPATGTAGDFFTALFTRTYRSELRPERNAQPALLYEANAAWFDQVFAASPSPARLAGPYWWPRQLCGKPLNLLRLLKAAFTFTGGADYIVAKLQRHSGVQLVLTDWQRRHPVLAAPQMLWRLRRMKAIR
jgi:hypothetical protein